MRSMTFLVFFTALFLSASATAVVVGTGKEKNEQNIEAVQKDTEKKSGPKIVRVDNLGLELTIPQRWKVTKKKSLNKKNKETGIYIRDKEGNAHFSVYVLEDPNPWNGIQGWAFGTMKNDMEWYAEGYAWKIKDQERFEIELGGHTFAGITWLLDISGNTREMTTVYAEKEIADGPDQWILIYGYNKQRYTKITNDVKQMASSLLSSFHGDLSGLDGTTMTE